MTTLSARWATDDERARWDELVTANPAGGDFLQSSTVAEAKVPHGMEPKYVVFERSGETVSAALFHERKIPGLGRLWLGNRAPGVKRVDELEEHLDALRLFLRRHGRGVFLVTFEPPIVSAEETEAALLASASLTAPDLHRREGIQGNWHTALVDVSQDDDALLASFNKKSRNMVRRAARDGLEVREYEPNQETFDRMHELMRSVGGGEKEGLMLRPKPYVEALWRGFAERGQGRFFGVDVDGTAAVMAFVIRMGSNAFYKDGGSQRELSSPGMSNLLHFEIMRRLREEGATVYDMFGVAPPEAQSNADHVSYASGNFKLTFAPRTTHIGAFDLVVRKLPYRVWNRIGERAYAKLYRSRTGDFSIY